MTTTRTPEPLALPTAAEVRAMSAGPALDALVAELCMGYTRTLGPAFDYDGPCEADTILVHGRVPHGYSFPPRGRIALTHFVPSYSTNWRDEFLEVMRRCDVTLGPDGFGVWSATAAVEVVASDPREAVCKAAVLAALAKRAVAP